MQKGEESIDGIYLDYRGLLVCSGRLDGSLFVALNVDAIIVHALHIIFHIDRTKN